MSGDCSFRKVLTRAWSGSNPVSSPMYPMPLTVSRMICSIGTSAWVVTSPITQRKSFVTAASQATREAGSCASMASRMASETWSQTLSG